MNSTTRDETVSCTTSLEMERTNTLAIGKLDDKLQRAITYADICDLYRLRRLGGGHIFFLFDGTASEFRERLPFVEPC